MFEERINTEKIPDKTVADQEREGMYEVAKRGLGGIFKIYDSGVERVSGIKAEVIRMAKYLDNSEEILANLDACIDIQTKKEFAEKVFSAAKPLVDLKIANPQLFIADGDVDIELNEVNEVISYEQKGNTINVHIIPRGVYSDTPEKIKKGLSILADVVSKNNEIEMIGTDESWIVARHPKIVEKFGFKIDGNKKDSAYTSREEFLDRYLGK